jgi:3-oxoacyl-[acyl-carrier-protein] synthase II
MELVLEFAVGSKTTSVKATGAWWVARTYPGGVAHSSRRVVVTGLGIVSPIGNSVEAAWTALLAGDTGAAEITRFDATAFQVRFACEVKDFDVTASVDVKAARRMDRCTHLLVGAARQAERDAGLDISSIGERAGTAIGTALGGVASFGQAVLQLAQRGPDRVSPFSIVQTLPNLAAGWVSIELGTRGPLLAQSTACAASSMAIGDALDAIRLGRADLMVCGGAEAPVTPVSVAGFAAMRALSTRNDDPASASRPFDRERDGFVIAEAAAVLVLEELEHARARGARVYAELSGYGVSSDANHVSDPDPVGANAARAVHMALADAALEPGDVGYVNAHGTSTPAGDSAETRVLKLVFGDCSRPPLISSTKGATGHTLGAAGAVEAVFTVLALHRGVLPPTINHAAPDRECDLDYLPNAARAEQVDAALSNSFGFGGHNSVLAFRRWAGD